MKRGEIEIVAVAKLIRIGILNLAPLTPAILTKNAANVAVAAKKRPRNARSVVDAVVNATRGVDVRSVITLIASVMMSGKKGDAGGRRESVRRGRGNVNARGRRLGLRWRRIVARRTRRRMRGRGGRRGIGGGRGMKGRRRERGIGSVTRPD